MLSPSFPILSRAREHGYAVGGFNVVGFESIGAILRAAEAERSPVLMMIWSGFGDVAQITALAAAARVLGERATVPVALHLDHEPDLERFTELVEAGFTSAMIDGSARTFEDNVLVTREAIERAHAAGTSVEAVMGEIGNEGGGGDASPTRVDDARRFFEAARPDVLAVSVGTQHGRYSEPPKLDLERLQAIARVVPAPLVLHGGSYCPPDQLRTAIELGIAKVNVATELDDTFLSGVARVAIGEARYVGDVVGVGFGVVEAKVREKMQLLGSSGRAS